MKQYQIFLINFFEKSKFNIFASSWINFFGSPLYYIICAKVLPQPYESLHLRLFSSAISIPLLFTTLYPQKFRPYIALYWYFWIIVALPITFTFFLLMNDFSGTWLVAETVMLFIVMIFIGDLVSILAILILGIFTAYIGYYLYTGNHIALDHRLLEYLVPVPLAMICGILFSYNAKKGDLERERNKNLEDKAASMKSLAGSIAHEIRNPLNAINLIGSQISDTLKQDLVLKDKEKLHLLTSQISNAISGANSIINVILSDLSEKPIEPSDFVYLTPKKILPQIIQDYGYKDLTEKTKVRFLDLSDSAKENADQQNQNFTFRAVPERLTFIVYNLLKNALYYLKQYPDSIVTIGTEQRVINIALSPNG